MVGILEVVGRVDLLARLVQGLISLELTKKFSLEKSEIKILQIKKILYAALTIQKLRHFFRF